MQEFQVLRCYKCFMFQVQQVKKSNKWTCKMCGAKQSMQRVFGQGTGLECRKRVQKLNMLKGDMDEQAGKEATTVSDGDVTQSIPPQQTDPGVESKQTTDKWSMYLPPDVSTVDHCTPDDNFTLDRDHFEKTRKNVKTTKRQSRQTHTTHTHDHINKENKNIAPRLNSIAKFGDKSTTNDSAVCHTVDTNLTHVATPVTFPNDMGHCDRPTDATVVKTASLKRVHQPVVSSNSKWAKFVPVENNESNSDEDSEDVTSGAISASQDSIPNGTVMHGKVESSVERRLDKRPVFCVNDDDGDDINDLF